MNHETSDIGNAREDHIAELMEASRTWEYWRECHRNCGRCDIGRSAGVWALGILEREYGTDWLRTVEANAQLPTEIAMSPSHSANLVEIVRYALLLLESLSRPGFAQVRKAMRSDLTNHRQTHTRIQLEVAALFASLGASVVFEEKSVADRPVDLFAQIGDLEIRVETFAIFPDYQLRAGNDVMNQYNKAIMDLQWEYDVFPIGEVLDGYKISDFEAIVAELRRAAAQAKSTNEPAQANHRYLNLRFVPQRLVEDGSKWTIPGGDPVGWARTRSKLRDKALQAAKSGPTWLRVDLLDTMWQLSQWARYSIYDKTSSLAAVTHEALVGLADIRGVVFSDGGMTTLSRLIGESSMPVNSAFGMYRKLWALRSRECIIVQIDDSAAREADLWWRVYDQESTWLTSALEQQGFPPADELIELRPN